MFDLFAVVLYFIKSIKNPIRGATRIKDAKPKKYAVGAFA
jgi:hypothetical protein